MYIFNIEVRLYFPTIDREFVYKYDDADIDEDQVEESYRDFYEHEAPHVFALYGYAPMDVTTICNGNEVSTYKSCYQETLWGVFFNEGGKPWFGRFAPFEWTLLGYRHRSEEHEATRYPKHQLQAA